MAYGCRSACFENKDNMKNLTVLTVAFAAGLTSFAAHAQDGAVRASKAIIETSKKASAAKANKIDDCPYLFGCSAKKEAAIDNFKTASIGAKGAKTVKEQAGKTAKAAKANAPYGEIVARYASTYGVPVSLAHAVISVESNYRPNARGSAGEIGLMQIKPATARMMGYSGSAKGLFNPETNIKFGLKYLAKAHELSGGTTCGTILRYNAGHGAKRMNPISAAYCKKVQARIGG
ncbi:soluble lytic murein transglycosylase-like protein [Aminobacter aminovorans]|jgi:soluble lytic murein transglycosylase-like protein|uniref:Soluble lytic murein transglycosylase n=1 Tax=Aminobacter aminovorans TaxID=83263 RepID=A0A380WKD9_AMIAI|nr:transglycosylase SLT domain-containing protein [Aminobacter aminovorans]TCS24287.1 soluble lytic murein transglycosylase-like protein [Aminobacter aminovorans]SUU89205.1 Soluble lytic murein transglycosylase precursor [Aminobacter aminovorans]